LSNRIKEIESQHPKESRVATKLTRPCSFVQNAKIYLGKQKPLRWRGFEDVINTSSGLLSISVTKKNVPRTLRFIDSFIKLLGKRGHKIEISEWDTIVIINEERFKIKFREKCSRKVFQQNPWTTNELVPNGKLSVKVVHPYNTKEWQDGSIKLEQQLTKIVAALELRADKEKLERAKIKKYWAEQKRLQAIKDKEENRKQIEARKIEMLLDHSAKWKVAQDLSLFISEIEIKHNDKEPSSYVSDWLNWARSVENSLNPISENVEKYIEQYDTEFN
jgi:predicted transcriptional regulator